MTAAPYQVMPPLSADEYAALRADIAERGVMVPVEYDEQGAVLDGHHRIQICEELGVTQWPRLIRYGLSEPEKRRHARRLNINRRHLNGEQKREHIEAELREAPDSSDRSIATGLGVDHKTVGVVRDALESTGEIPQLEERKGKDERIRRIVQYVDPSPEGIRGSKLTAKTIHHAERESYRVGARGLALSLSDATALQPTGRKFPVVYADPPWKRKAGFTDRSYENHFPTMTWDQIAAMPVAARSLPDAWLFMWMPRAHMLASTTMTIEVKGEPVEVPTTLAQKIARAWGFKEYSTCFVWTKTDAEHPENIGSGLIVRDQDEILLLFKRGRGMPMPDTAEKFGSNHREMPAEHSRKPDFYREMIATMTGGLPVMELFARVDAEHPLPPNFFAWGNQSDHSVDVTEMVDPDTGEIIEHVGEATAEPAIPATEIDNRDSAERPVDDLRNEGGGHVDAPTSAVRTSIETTGAGEGATDPVPVRDDPTDDIGEIPDHIRRRSLTKNELALLNRISLEDCDKSEQVFISLLRKEPSLATVANQKRLLKIAEKQGLMAEEGI